MNNTSTSPVPSPTKTRSLGLPLVAVGLAGLVALWVPSILVVGAQTSGSAVATKFSLPIYKTNRLESLLTGASGVVQSNGMVLLTQPRVRIYADDGGTNLEIASATCVFNNRTKVATGSSPIHVESGDGRLKVDGQSFWWWQTNNNLTVSNQVRAHIHRSLQNVAVSASIPASVPATGDQSAFDVEADRLVILQRENLVICEGNVRVDDPQLALTCQRLTVRRTRENALESIVAEEQVLVVNRADQSRTTSERAVYSLGERGELAELSGRPRWTDGLREGRADLFFLDRPSDRSESTLRAFGSATLRLPRPRGGTEDLFSFTHGASTQAAGTTNQSIDVSAGMFTLQLPSTNGALRSILAETNVLISTLDGNMRATADRAAYSPDGVMDLTGSPVWTSQGRTVKAARLVLDPARQAFHAQTNAVVTFPVAGLAKSLGPESGKATPTNHYVEITAEHVDYADGWLTFSPQVHGVYLDGERRLGELNCATLKAHYTNQIESLFADGGVHFVQYPSTNSSGKRISRNLTCETLDVRFTPDGRIKVITGDGRVLGEQQQKTPTAPKESLSRAECDRIVVEMDPSTNQVRAVTAQGNVRLSRDDRKVTSERAVYTGTNHLLTLTGHPLITLPDGEITGTDVLTWDTVTGKYRAGGMFKAQWRGLQGRTNLMKLLPLKQPSKDLRPNK